jgi:predicted metal-dependent phosphoesterase TrpH
LDHAEIEAFLERARAGRRARAEEMVARLQALGMPVEMAAVERYAGGAALCRPHVARALVEAGASGDVDDAFRQWIGRGRPAYVEKVLPCFTEVADLVHAAGGLAVAAHLGEHGSEGHVRHFQAAGLDGLEVRHPSHPPATERRLLGIAQRLGLAVTGGSDWHGETEIGRSHASLGGLQVPAAWLEQLDRRRAEPSRQQVVP